MHITDALKLLDDTKAKQDPEGMEPEKDIYKMVDKAAPTIGAWSQRQHIKLVRREEERRQALKAQGEWKAAGIE
jgi:spore cortex formation protein SpoVR/YcgB (stage V sporulation)